ncbi:pheST operon leader peptide PheM [Klebsiella aerogenes]|nr:pheST operon leader peptide PheM [Klebsiella aerogenes]EIW9045893.1 pheST operon leader peptide PheM [Klebsiella pneumoniae]THI53302.1 pheST operon leader peptide PheM [Klebsiella pneumoniae subsp. pneumoniae]AYY02358.1 pheST operon leader peptide PheM [Klebsiella aerogenes]EIW9478016.1 pheST operon leader peptide PheM [Klebsiella aerogenes]
MLLFSASFFTLAPELRRLARERRNGKQRQKASPVEAFFVYRFGIFISLKPVSAPT